MRIAIDTTRESEFIQKSLEQLAADHHEDEWIRVPPLKTKGFARLLPASRNKARQLMEIKPDVLIMDTMPPPGLVGIPVLYYDGNKIDLISEKGKSSHTIYAAPSDARLELDWHEKYSLKQRYSDGKEFFLTRMDIGPGTPWESLFKAFSIFKKWQQTEVLLLVSATIDEDYEKTFDDKFASYKFRNDVRLLQYESEFLEVLPAAYGVLIRYDDPTGMDILNAFKAGVPVITSNKNIFHEAVSGSILPAENDVDETGRQIINLYRDEHLRDTLAERGKEVVKQFTWESTSRHWYDLISKFAR